MNLTVSAEKISMLNNSSAMETAANATEEVGAGLEAFAGNWQLLLGALLLIIVAFLVIYLLKQVIANAIIGIIALLIIKFVFKVPIPLTPLVILVTVLGGGGGVGALLIATYFGWM